MSDASQLLSFDNAISQAKSESQSVYLLLGNGFSIGCDDKFDYKSLCEKAKLSERLKELLAKYGNNFEETLKYLNEAVYLAKHYGLDKNSKFIVGVEADCQSLKDKLIEAISKIHPPTPGDVDSTKFIACSKFLKYFYGVFTTNYDLIIYWAMNHIRKETPSVPLTDGFGKNDSTKVECQFTRQFMSNIPFYIFLHGALHLYTHPNDRRVYKRTSKGGAPLIDQVKENLGNEKYPLIVTEGDSKNKLKQIASNSYLDHVFEKFKQLEGHLFIYGHSLSEQDSHLTDALIEKWSKKWRRSSQCRPKNRVSTGSDPVN